MSGKEDAGHENNGARARHAGQSRKRAGFSCGAMMIVAGILWLLARVGVISFAWLNGIPVWPILLILCGVWIVASGLFRRMRRADGRCC